MTGASELPRAFAELPAPVVAEMYERVFGRRKSSASGRTARLEQLVGHLARPGAAALRPAGWTEGHEAAASLMLRWGQALPAEVALACLGYDRPAELLERVVALGAVFPAHPTAYARTCAAILWGSEGAWRATPAYDTVTEPPPRPLNLARVDAARVRPGPPPDAARLASALLALCDACESRELKARVDGWPAVPTCRVVEKTIALPAGAGAARLLLWATAAGLLVPVQGRLRARAPTPREPVALLRRVLDGLCATEAWIDDVPSRESDIVYELTEGDFLAPRASQAGAVRAGCAALLARLDSDDWVSIDALVARVLEANPSLGFMAQPNWPGERWSPRTLGATDTLRQRALVQSVFCHTFRLLGLVEVGAVDEPYVAPERPPFRPELDAAHRGRHSDYHGRANQLPTFVAPPSPYVVRRTALGRAVLGLPASLDAPAASLHVGADFELQAPERDLSLADALWLDRVAVATGQPGDPVRRWRLDRRRWGEAIQAGLAGAASQARLAEMAPRGLPDNVRVSLEDWTRAFGVVQLTQGHDLAEWPSAADRDRAVAGIPGARAVGERFALVEPGALKAPVVDYQRPPPRWLRLGAKGVVEAAAPGHPDLLGEGRVAALCCERGGVRQLDPAKLRGLARAAVEQVLEPRSVAPMHPEFAALLAAYTGEIGAPRARAAELLLLEDQVAARWVMALPGAATHLAGWLGGGVLEVKPGHTAKLKKLLAELGVEVG